MARNTQDIETSRRKILKSLSVTAVAGNSTGVVGASDPERAIENADLDIDITQLSGEERKEAVSQMHHRMGVELAKLEQYITNAENILLDWDNPKALRVDYEDSYRYVVNITASEDIDKTVFMQYNGFDMMESQSINAQDDMPNVMGMKISDRVTGFHLENGEVAAEHRRQIGTESKIVPCSQEVGVECGGGGVCGTCLVETGVDCAPGWDCLVMIAAAAEGGNWLVQAMH